MGKVFKLTEEQYRILYKHVICEELDNEGLNFKSVKGSPDQRVVSYTPGANSKIDDTIFNDDKSLKVRKVLLPKSNIVSYNLYDIKNMDVNKALKHGTDMQKRNVMRDDKTMKQFINRSVMLIKHIIGNNTVDIITFPQSSSKFNREITNKLIQMFPKSEGIKLQPELLVKNVRNIFVNVDTARQVGLSDEQIHRIQTKVDKWKRDEDIRDVRRKIEQLKSEIETMLAQRGNKRGRLPNDITQRKQQIDLYNQDIAQLRKGQLGKDPTIDKATGKVKNWQIKSIDDKERRSIEGIFELNPQYKNIQYKLNGKHIIVFDDNLSSGATLDDVCLALKNLGAASVMPFTLGVIAPTLYNPHERGEYNKNH
jgi:hypothetical protein